MVSLFGKNTFALPKKAGVTIPIAIGMVDALMLNKSVLKNIAGVAKLVDVSRCLQSGRFTAWGSRRNLRLVWMQTVSVCIRDFIEYMYYVYILRSLKNDSYYKGCTSDLQQRLGEHNSGKEVSTKRYAPWELIWSCSKPTLSEARILEKKLKNITSRKKLEAFIVKYS